MSTTRHEVLVEDDEDEYGIIQPARPLDSCKVASATGTREESGLSQASTSGARSCSLVDLSRGGLFETLAQPIQARNGSSVGSIALPKAFLIPTQPNRSVDRRGSGEKEGAVVDQRSKCNAYYLSGLVGDRMHMRIDRKFTLLQRIFEDSVVQESARTA